MLFIPVRVKGKERPFVLDTGAGITCVGQTLAAKLGRPVGIVTAHHWGEDLTNRLYVMPAIYLGGARLRNGTNVMALDLKSISILCGQPIEGILGMDVLKHYCVQVDFAANKVRFLDDSQGDKPAWGRAFPMGPLNDEDPRPAVAGNLFGEEGPHSIIDSGYDGAGWLMPKRYAQWTNQAAAPSPATAHSPDARFFGETYPGMRLNREDVESDGMGLKFLARHLVTLDFPKKTLYLKRTNIGPLPNVGESAVVFLKNLKERGLLPGWPKDEHGTPKEVKQHKAAHTVEVEAEKQGESAIYHYKLMRASPDGPWSLIKAWRTDAKGRVLEDYPVLKEIRP
ncbi:MAG TPA: retropepsin-like aspartic protease [Candidatus Acidoferrum sp.]|nr:retropepsin-like aspartic protease [Candidatus Acidoferrum sp.]